MESKSWKPATTSQKEDWETPQKMFEELNDKYHFTYDLAANDINTKCEKYFSKEDDSLSVSWKDLEGNLFLNPPYSRQLKHWIEKAYRESLEKKDGNIVLVIPSRTDTSYWHDYIFHKAEIKFLRGRIKFEFLGKSKDPAPFPSAIVIYKCGK